MEPRILLSAEGAGSLAAGTGLAGAESVPAAAEEELWDQETVGGADQDLSYSLEDGTSALWDTGEEHVEEAAPSHNPSPASQLVGEGDSESDNFEPGLDPAPDTEGPDAAMDPGEAVSESGAGPAGKEHSGRDLGIGVEDLADQDSTALTGLSTSDHVVSWAELMIATLHGANAPPLSDVFGQSYSLSASVGGNNTMLSSAERQAILDGLQGLVEFGELLSSYEMVAQVMPFIGFSIGETLELDTVLETHWYQPVANYLQSGGAKDSDGLLAVLASLDTSVGGLEVTVQDGSVSGGLNGDEVEFHLTFEATRTLQGLPISIASDTFGSSGGGSAMVDLEVSVFFDVSFGVLRAGNLSSAESFFMRVDQMRLTADVHENDLGSTINIGFLGADLLSGNVNLDADLDVAFANPDQDGADRITLAELLGTSLENLITLTPTTSQISGQLAIEATLGNFSTGSGTAIFLSGDPFSVSGPTIQVAGSAASEVLNFTQIGPAGMTGVFEQVGNWLGALTLSEAMGQSLPYTQGSLLGELIPLEQAFQEALTTHFYGEPGFYTFGNAQELASLLASLLNVDLGDVGLNYDPSTDRLSYRVELEHTFEPQQVPLTFASDLGPVNDLTTASELTLTATGTVALTVQVQLTNTSVSYTGAVVLPSNGRLSGDAAFELGVNGLAPVPVVVSQDNSNSNRSQLIADINQALADAGLGNVTASLFSNRLRFTANGPLAGASIFIVSPFSGAAVTELGLTSGTVLPVGTLMGQAPLPHNGRLSDNAMFEIRVGNGPAVPVTVAQSVTSSNANRDHLVTDVANALSGAGVTNVTVTLENNVLKLMTTGGQAGQALWIGAQEGNVAATELGFAPELIIEATTSLDHVYVENVSLGGIIGMDAPSIQGSALFGFVGIQIFDGQVEGDVTVSVTPKPSAPKRLTDLFDALQDAPAYFTTTRGGTIDGSFQIGVDGGLVPLGLAPIITFEQSDLFDPGTVAMEYLNLGDLPQYANLDFDHVRGALTDLGGYLDKLTSTTGHAFNQALPFLNRSLADLLGLVEAFDEAVEAVQTESPSTLQAVGQILEQAMGPGTSVSLLALNQDFRVSIQFLAAPLSQSSPIDLDLGRFAAAAGGVPNLAGVTGLAGNAMLNVTATASLDLIFGFDLGAANNPRAYLHDSSDLTGTIRVVGTGLDFGAAMGALGIRIDGGTVTLGIGGSPGSLLPATMSLEMNDTPSTGGRHYNIAALSASLASSSIVGEAHATLPVDYPQPGSLFGIIDLDIGSLGNVNGTTSLSAPDFAGEISSIDLLNDLGSLADGLDQLLAGLDAAMKEGVLGLTLPVVGDGLAESFGFIEELRAAVVQELNAAFNNGSGPRTLSVVENALTTALQNLGLIAGGTQVVGVPGPNPSAPDQIQFNVMLSRSLTASQPVGLDLGIPGLGLEVDPNSAVSVMLGYTFDLRFGVSRSDGVYFDTSAVDELSVELSVSLDGLNVTGQLGFLIVDIADSASDPSAFSGTFTVDLQDPVGAGKRLTLNELLSGSANPAGVFDARLDAVADVNLLLVAGFGDTSELPSLAIDFHLGWVFAGASLTGSTPVVEFNNVRLNLGEFLSGLVQPVLNNLTSLFEPLEPFIDVLTARLPVISDLLGRTVTILDVAKLFGNGVETAAVFIEAIADILDFADSLQSVGDNVYITLGSFDFSGLDLRQPRSTPLTFEDVPSGNFDLNTDTMQQVQNQASTFYQASTSIEGGGFSFPVVENPAMAMRLLFNEDIDLFLYDMPRLNFTFQYTQFIPVYAFFGIRFGGSVNVTADFAFGYDTYGVRQFAQNPDNPLLLFDGFYVADWVDGMEVPEASITGKLLAGAGADVGLASVFVDGGIFATLNFDLNDDVEDGKFRGKEILDRLGNGVFCLFDIFGEIGAFLSYEIEIGICPFCITVGDEIVRVTMISFEILCEEPPVLADLAPDGTLTLNMGPRAGERLHGDTTDGDESFIVTRVNDDIVLVEAFGFTQAWGAVPPYNDPDGPIGPAITRIVADAGNGRDWIEIDADLTDPVELKGGPGDDVLVGGSGNDHLEGGAGYDKLFGGDGADTLYGHSPTAVGDDRLKDTLYGGNGNDALYGDGGNDVLMGENGDDDLYGGPDDDHLYGGAGQDELFGQGQNDVLLGGDQNDLLDGGAGEDLLFGGLGDDQLEGGQGADIIAGEAGSDIIYGHTQSGAGDDHAGDTIYGGFSPQTIPNPEGDVAQVGDMFDIIYGQGGPDRIFGQEGPDLIYGGAGDDDIRGGSDDDIVFGGTGNDIIRGESGADTLHGDENDDTIYGGTGADTIYGEDGHDRLHGDSGDDFLFGENGDDTLKGGTGADTLVGGAGQDVIRGQEEDDQIFGQHDDDTLFGDDGDDLVLGHEGDDFLHGGRGRDRLEGGSDNDVILGGDHRDHLFGEDGQDVLAGNEGDDFLDGGAGVDDLFGNEGNDILHAGSGLGGLLDGGDGDDAITGSDEGGEDGNFNDAIYFGDRIVGGAGNDRIWGLGGADHILGGLGDDEIDGGAHGDWIQGEAGHDRLYGGFGQDRLEGGVGDDLLDGGADADELFGGDGDDNLSGGGGTGDDLQGGDGDDVIRGSDDGADTIAGGPGRDRIYGMGGNDVINGGSGDDIIDGGAGDDFIEGGAGSDLIVGGADHDTIYGHSQSGVGDDNAVDYLYGDFGTNGNEVGSGRDRLFGQGGNDYLYGEGEDDLIQAGAGSSHVIEYGAGESGTPGDFVTPSPTPNPVLGSVTNHDAEGTVPFGVDYLGRWTEFGGSASVSGVSGHPAFSLEPSVAAGAGGQYVAWADARNGNFEIFVLAHAAGAWQMLGASAAQGGVSQSLGSSRRPSLTLDSNGQPVVAWTEFNGAASNIYVAGYDPAANGGSGGWVALGNSLSGGGVSGTGGADHAVVVSTASGLVVAWEDDSSGTTQVYAKQFSGGAWVNLGAGSSSGNGVSGASTDIRQLSLATNGTRVAAVWTQRVGGVDQIYLREYNAGVWNSLSGSGSGTGISGAAQDATAPAVAYHAGSIFVAWEQDRPANVRPTAIYVARFNGSAWVAAGSGALGGDGVSNSEGVGLRPQLASNGGRLHLVWVDETVRANKAALYARVWNGSAFAEELPGDASGQGISETGGETRETVLAVDPAGRPYVAWEEAETRGATEIFFRGNTWDLGTVHQANSGTSVQSILNNNNLGLGDVIYVAPGTYASGFSVTGDDAGVLILGAPFRTSLVQGAVTVSNIAQVVLQRLAFSGGVTFTNTTDAALANSQLSGTGLVLQGGTNTQVLHNRITNSTGDGLRVGAGTQGLVAHNSVRNATTALRLDGAFDGWIYDNELAFSSTGVNYNAAAALRDNRIHSNQLGVAITVTGEASGLGYVGGAWTNDIFANDTGVDLADGTRMRAQHIRENSFGVTGGGLLGGDDFDTANLIENNGVGVEFDGTIQFNRIAFNETGILAMSGQRILHNLIYRNTDYGVLISGQSEVVIANNTFYAPTGDNVRITAASSAVDVRSNIMWAESGYNLYVANDSQTGFSSDYNTQHVSGTGRIGYWTKDFVDLLDWQADIARFDLHSIGRTVVHPEWSEPAFANRRLDRYEVLGLTAGQRFSSPTLDSADPRTDVGQAPTYLNLLANAGFESGLSGWTTNPGAAASGAGPVAFEGQAYFAGGNVQDGFAQQIIDLLAAGYTAGQLDGQDLELVFGARLRSLAENALDRGQIRVTFLDGADGALREELVAVDPGSDAWTLAGDRVQIPVGARKVVFRLESLRVTGLNTDAYGDNAFVYVVNETTTPNQGAYGHTLFETSTLPTYIALRFPDLYVDWERDKPLTILWDTLSNTGDSPVRIELYQDDPAHGPGLLAVIAASTPDDGEHIWIPSTAGVDFGTYDLRIRVSLVNNPTVHDRSTESFTVPESGTMYYVDDGSDVNDEYTPTSTGSNRHTGKLPSAPKPNPVNVFRVYAVTGGATVHVDTGNYPLIVPLTLSGSLDLGLGLDEGFHLAGPTNAARTAALFPAVPGQLFEALVEINDADFVTVRHLSLRDAERGVWVHNGSDNFDVDHVTVHDHTEYGLRIDTAQPTSVFTFLTAYDNGFNGIFVQGAIGGLTDSLIYGNGFSGANLRGQNGGVIEANIVYGNDQHGLDIQNLSGAFTVVGSSNLAAGRGNVVYDNRFTGIEATGNVHIYGNTVRGPGSVGIRASSGDVGWNVVEGVQTGISGGQGIIANNRVYHNGIGLRTASPVITGNVVYSNTTGIELQFGADLVANNLIYANSADGLVTTFSATGQIVNNTFHQTGSGNLIRTGNSSAFEIRNNIFSIGDGTALRIDPTSQSGITADYNLFHSTGAGRVGYWQNVDRATLQDWRNASTLDENSLWADPRFVNPAGADGLVGYGSQTQDGRDDDFHLQGLFGSFHGGSLAPVRDLGTSLPTMPGFTIVNDANQSPGIDRANPSDGFVQETPNNGGYRNLGAYGNTAQASRSPAQFILLVRPDGGESVIQNSTFTIRWHAGGFAGNVDLAYSSTGLGGPFITLAANEANDGSYDWVVDAGTFAAGDNYALRIRSTATPAIGDVSSAVFRVGIPITAYYVDDNSDVGDEYTPGATGNDANDGLSPFTPKASIRAILEAYDLEPGNIIYVDTGMYALTLNIVLAAQDSGVVIQGPVQGGHEAVLDRGNNSSFGSNYIFEFTGADNVTIAGLSLTNSRDAIFASTSADSDGLTIAGNRIYDNYEGISLSTSNDGVTVQGNEVFDNNSFGIRVDGLELAIENNVAYGNQDGVVLFGGASTGIVAGNDIYANSRWGIRGSGTVLITQNTVHDHTANNSSGINGGRDVVANVVYGNVLGISGGTNIVGNRVFANDVGMTGGTWVVGNTIYSNGIGARNPSSSNGGFVNNVVYDNTDQGVLIQGGSSLKIRNNTFYQPQGQAVRVEGFSSNTVLANNIMVVENDFAVWVAGTSQAGFSSDYNLYHLSGSGRLMQWGNAEINGLLDLFLTVGLDRNSLAADPQFVSPAGADGLLGYDIVNGTDHGADDDFHLAPGSPGVDRGDPFEYYLLEPTPQGGRINLGAYGNTPEATVSAAQFVQVTAPDGQEKLEEGEVYEIRWRTGGLGPYDVAMLMNVGNISASFDYGNEGVWMYHNFQTRGGNLGNTSSLPTVTGPDPAPANVYRFYAQGSSGVGNGLSYDLPVPDGEYVLVLHFVEPSFNGSGSRRFDIVLEGDVALANYDVFAEAGARFRGYGEALPVTVSDGNGLQIDLNNLTSVGAVLSGIELRSVNPGGMASPTVALEVSTDAGASWLPIASGQSMNRFGQGSYSWNAGPQTAGSTALVRITADQGSMPQDTSDDFFSIGPAGQLYYVNDGSLAGDEYTTAPGDNTNTGKSPDRPLASLSAVLLSYDLEPGDIILVDTGTYGVLSTIFILEEDAGVTVRGPVQAGHAAVLDGNGIPYVIELNRGHDVTLDHLTLTNAGVGVGWNSSLETSDRVTISNSEIYGTTTGVDFAIGGNEARVLNSVFYQNSTGVRLAGINTEIIGNEVFDNSQIGLNAGSATVRGNVVYDNGADGIRSGGIVENNVVYGHNGFNGTGIFGSNTARNNVVYDNRVGITGVGTVEGNRVFGNAMQGIVGGSNAAVRDNVVYSNDIGIQLNSAGTASGNLVYDNATAGLVVNLGARIVGNTIHAASGDAIRLQSDDYELRNNILWASTGYVIRAESGPAQLESDYNLYFAAGSARMALWEAHEFVLLEDWRFEIGVDAHSRMADPLFVEPAGLDGQMGYDAGSGIDYGADDDFHLQAGSPGIDAADPLSYFLEEPGPNGGRANLGFYGNTAEAATSTERFVQILTPNGWERFEQGQTVPVEWHVFGLNDIDTVGLINVGGPTIASGSLGYWLEDRYRVGGGTSGNTLTQMIDLSGTDGSVPEAMYQSYAQTGFSAGSVLGYALPVADGAYQVRLHFVEPSFTTTGLRLFDIQLQGDVVRSDFDIVEEAGARRKAVSVSFDVTAQAGEGILLELVNQANGALLSGIEITQVNPDGSANAAVALAYSANQGAAWTELAGGLLANRSGYGTYDWTVGQTTAGFAGLLRVQGAQFPNPTDVSDHAFLVANNGNVYYVNDGDLTGDEFTSAAGDNYHSGKSPDRPMASLQALLLAYDLDYGDTIFMDTGVYVLLGNVRFAGQDSGVRVQGPFDLNHAAVLDRNRPATPDTAAIQIVAADDIVLDRLEVLGGWYGIWSDLGDSGARLAVTNSQVHNNNNSGIYLRGLNADALIEGNGVFNNGTTTAGVGIQGGSDAVVRGNDVFGNATGIFVPSGLVENNVVHDNTSLGISASGITTIRGNVVFGQTGSNDVGIFVGTGSASHRVVVQDNRVFDNQIGLWNNSGTGTVIFENNRVYRNLSVGIQSGLSTIIRGNAVYSNPTGILLNGFSSAAKVHNNLLYGNTNQAMLIQRGNGHELVNNTVYQGVGDALKIETGARGIVVANNIIWVELGLAINLASNSQTDFVGDYNLFYLGASGTGSVGMWNGALQASLASWQSASGQGANSLTGNPMFVDIDGPDNVLGDLNVAEGDGDDDNFGLLAGSPAIDAANAFLLPSETDQIGQGRRDDPSTPDTGIGWPEYTEQNLGSSLYADAGELPSSGGDPLVTLPFTFTFYGQDYDQMRIARRSGFVQFGNTSSSGFTSDNDLEVFRQSIRIAPLWDHHMLGSSNFEGVYLDDTVPGEYTVRWSGVSAVSGGEVNFSLTLFANGDIRFDYGEGNQGLTPLVGISAGNGSLFVLSAYDGQSSLNQANSILWTAQGGLTYFDRGALEFQGSSADTTPPQVTGIPGLPASGGFVENAFTSLQIFFDEAMDAISARSPGNYELRGAGLDGAFDTTDDVLVVLAPAYSFGSDRVTLQLTEGVLAPDQYRLTLSGSRAIYDTAGNPLDGDANGLPGGDYVHFFTATNAAPVVVSIQAGASDGQRSNIDRLQIVFSEDVSGSLGLEDFQLLNLSTVLPVGAGLMQLEFDAETGLALLTFPGYSGGQLPAGNYRLTVLSAGITDSGGLPMAANVVLTFHVLGGDANGDRVVNELDLFAVWRNLALPEFQRDLSVDVNGDGQISQLDLDMVRSQYLGSLPPSAQLAGMEGQVTVGQGNSMTGQEETMVSEPALTTEPVGAKEEGGLAGRVSDWGYWIEQGMVAAQPTRNFGLAPAGHSLWKERLADPWPERKVLGALIAGEESVWGPKPELDFKGKALS